MDTLSLNIPITTELIFGLRIVLAGVCGMLIGIERTRRLKEAGIRTHAMVACTACLLMILSKYGFSDLVNADGSLYSGVDTADPARIAAQVISGVSFLGAGVIFKAGSTIKGLNTASGIWATAGIGMCLGAGLYLASIFTTLIVLALQYMFHRYNFSKDTYVTNVVSVTMRNWGTGITQMRAMLDEMNASVFESEVIRNEDGTVTFNLSFKSPKALTSESTLAYMDAHPEVLSFESLSIL